MNTKKFPNNPAYAFAKSHGLGDAAAAIRSMEIQKWNRPYTTSVRRGYLIELFQKAGIFEEFLAKEWPNGKTAEGQSNIAFSLQLKEEYSQFLERAEEESESEVGAASEEGVKFALELHLRDFLAKNLEKIERGLTLYRSNETIGVEFPVDGGRIDILAIDKNGKPVVIELKLSQGRNKVLGQILYYMSWIDRNLGLGNSRGVIIANEIYPDLQLAASRAPGVELAVYKMQFSIERAGAG